MTREPSAASFPPARSQLIRLRTSDGVEVVADVAVVADPWAGAVVCHPHPAYGGDRHNFVVDRLFETLASARVAALRFDFRGGGDGGSGEQHDVVAGVDRIAAELEPDVPVWLVGCSFGAARHRDAAHPVDPATHRRVGLPEEPTQATHEKFVGER